MSILFAPPAANGCPQHPSLWAPARQVCRLQRPVSFTGDLEYACLSGSTNRCAGAAARTSVDPALLAKRKRWSAGDHAGKVLRLARQLARLPRTPRSSFLGTPGRTAVAFHLGNNLISPSLS
jgi:hypothetical protein